MQIVGRMQLANQAHVGETHIPVSAVRPIAAQPLPASKLRLLQKLRPMPGPHRAKRILSRESQEVSAATTSSR